MPFLSLLDDRAKPKGSRDPLGFELVWTHFGRKVVGNLTTITGSVENFAVALLGFYWAHQLRGDTDKDSREQLVRETFLRYEQLSAYLRYQAGSRDIMGITRVQQHMSANPDELSIGLHAQILSDQASYGLWGLYSSALKDSGLIEGSERKPTAKGEELAQEMCTQLEAETFKALFDENGFLPRETCEKLALQYLRAVRNEEIGRRLTHILLRGGHSDGGAVQGQLFEVTQELMRRRDGNDNTAVTVDKIVTHATGELKQRLEDIKKVESVLVAANNLFYYLLKHDHQKLETVLVNIEAQKYRYDHLPETLPQGGPRRDALDEINQHLRAGYQREAIQALIRLNANIMRDRGGAPWVSCEAGDTLNVKVKSEKANLRGQCDLLNKWDYDYFLGCYLRIAEASWRANHG